MFKSAFDNLIDFYEAMIDWPKRLANEEPFYRHWFDKTGVRRVVDVACGTGRHVAMFQQWGLCVEGSDLSQPMIAYARSHHGESDRLRFVVRSFDQPIEPPESFDAAICMGNSLALAPDMDTVAQAIRQMFAAVRPGGLVLIHAMNLYQLADGPCVWQKCKRATLPQGEVLILKGVHRCGSQGYVELLAATAAEGKLIHSESVPFLGLETAQLERLARESGASDVHFFGDYRQKPYDRERSVDLLMAAVK